MAVQLRNAIFLTSQSLLSEDVATTDSPGLVGRRQLPSPSPTGQLSSSLIPSTIEEANAAVTRIHKEAAAKKLGHYHHFSASVRAAISPLFISRVPNTTASA